MSSSSSGEPAKRCTFMPPFLRSLSSTGAGSSTTRARVSGPSIWRVMGPRVSRQLQKCPVLAGPACQNPTCRSRRPRAACQQQRESRGPRAEAVPATGREQRGAVRQKRSVRSGPSEAGIKPFPQDDNPRSPAAASPCRHHWGKLSPPQRLVVAPNPAALPLDCVSATGADTMPAKPPPDNPTADCRGALVPRYAYTAVREAKCGSSRTHLVDSSVGRMRRQVTRIPKATPTLTPDTDSDTDSDTDQRHRLRDTDSDTDSDTGYGHRLRHR